ncbi:HdeD family acid-resistance protein [Patescibacteria group bacterium]
MLKEYAQYWWLYLLRGIFTILFGIIILTWPGLTIAILVILFGVYTIVSGIFLAIAGLLSVNKYKDWWVVLLQGILGFAIGMIVLKWPGVTICTFLIIAAIWSIISGIGEIIVAISLRKEVKNEWLLALSGVLSFVLGVLLLSKPATGIYVITILIGIYAVLFGTITVAGSIGLRGKKGN